MSLSQEIAAWLQAVGTVGTFIWGFIVFYRQNKRIVELEDRRQAERLEDKADREKHQARLVSGWVELPQGLNLEDDGVAVVLSGTVLNRSEAPIWDVVVHVHDEQGALLSLPPLTAPLVEPNGRWSLRWAAGWRVEPWLGRNTTTSPDMLAYPQALARPGSRIGVSVTFTDSDKMHWRRAGSTLTRLEQPVDAAWPGSDELSRVMDMALSRRSTGDSLKKPGGVVGNLLEGLSEVGSHHMGLSPKRQVRDLESELENAPGRWYWGPEYTGHANRITTLIGALHRFGKRDESHTTYASDQEVDSALALTLYDQASAIYTAFGGLRKNHESGQ